MSIAYLGLGTNLGDREENLKQAVDLISCFPGTELIKYSKVYETDPWGYDEQDDFLNMCLEIKTNLTPKELLYKCQDIEIILKRERKIKWGPRTIDIDLLLYDDLVFSDQELIIPHPRIQERAFVLIPLQDLNSELIIKGKNIVWWIKKKGEEGVRELKLDL